MYFNFERLNAQIARLAGLQKILNSWRKLGDWLNATLQAVAGVSDEYARTYSQVQQTQYDADGNLQDVTSEERLQVPMTVLENAKANLESIAAEIAGDAPPDDVDVSAEVHADTTQVELTDVDVTAVDVMIYGGGDADATAHLPTMFLYGRFNLTDGSIDWKGSYNISQNTGGQTARHYWLAQNASNPGSFAEKQYAAIVMGYCNGNQAFVSQFGLKLADKIKVGIVMNTSSMSKIAMTIKSGNIEREWSIPLQIANGRCYTTMNKASTNKMGWTPSNQWESRITMRLDAVPEPEAADLLTVFTDQQWQSYPPTAPSVDWGPVTAEVPVEAVSTYQALKDLIDVKMIEEALTEDV